MFHLVWKGRNVKGKEEDMFAHDGTRVQVSHRDRPGMERA
jgi:hypothetical protein